MGPKGSAEGLASVPKGKKAEMCLLEKIHVAEKLYSGMNYSAPGHEVNVS